MTTSAIIGISVQLQHLHEVSDALVSMPEVRYVGASTGRYDLIIEASSPITTSDAVPCGTMRS